MPSRPGVLRRQLRISARVSVPCYYYCRACTSLFLFPFLFAFFFIRHFPFPVRSIDRHACRKPGNVTSLIIGVVKRVVRNNYEPVPCLVAAYKCVTRALRCAALFRCRWVAVNFKSRAGGEVSDLPCPTRGRCFNFAESNERVCLLHDRKNKRVNYISTD